MLASKNPSGEEGGGGACRWWAARIALAAFLLGAALVGDSLVNDGWTLDRLKRSAGTIGFDPSIAPLMDDGDDLVVKWMSEMSLKEKCDILRGSVDTKGYTGYVPGIVHLGIPSMRMNDGPQGFRGPKKTSTAFPCGLAMAATFWPELVKKVAYATGREFVRKGSNVLLGPGMNLARIAKNGRNFEYLCGEDPFLGEVMAVAYIKGVQANTGLIATAKHYINNEQETDRTKVSAFVDEETEWNMYYRPFKASVEAGVATIMCSYNKVNGHQGCASNESIRRDLEERMGFKGFVMSDWFAVTSTVDTAMAGTDVEMPIPLYYGDPLRLAVENGKVPIAVVDEKVRRVLSVLVRYNMTDVRKLDPGFNASTLEHSRLARTAAAHSIIMLKNEDNILPLTTATALKILVIGDRAQERVLSTGGGSGHVHPPYVITPLQGLRANAPLHEIFHAGTEQAISLPDETYSAADVVIVVVGTSSTEGMDRNTLALDPNEIDLVRQACTRSKKVIVAITAPGAVIMPFADKVQAVLLQFMPGQETGNALADVIYGKVDPGGARLPMTIPNRDNERNMTRKQYPGMNYEEEYAERTEIGYRWYVAHTEVKPRFPFGFGMSYARIKFLGVSFHKESDGNLVFHLGFINTSKVRGIVVPQIYVTKFPNDALKIVAPIALVGFERLELRPHDIRTVTIRVTRQSMSVWTKEKKDYYLFPGKYELSIGESSMSYWKTVTFDV